MPDTANRYQSSEPFIVHILTTPDMTTFGQAPATKPQHMNSGDSDVSPNGAPSQFLLIRSLEPTVSEDLLAKGVAKLYKPSRRSSPPASTKSKKNDAKVASTTGDANLGAKEGSLRRILLVRDRRSNESWRYGFAEFATIDVGPFIDCRWSLLTSYIGRPSSIDSLQLVRKVHHLFEARHS